ncbi:hypothetical protein niasHS_004919 [Heterodera schachtii]|uniref:Uncharacterized protein n=1 Tax=Heterodera schachtii TaxID=97005 RepID=A0ABD2K075_HETSC
MKRNFDRGTNARKNFEVNQRVYARNYRDGSKWIPGQITRKIGLAMLLVRTARGMWKRHFDQLKENLTDQNSDNSRSESEDNSDSEDEVPIDLMDDEQLPAPPEEQQQPEQPQQQANAEPRRSTRKRKKPKIFDPSA